MQIGQKGVKYGLQVRKPPERDKKLQASSIFGDDRSEDEETVEEQIARHAAQKATNKKTTEILAAAVAEDASIFDYDSHYDTIQRARDEPKRQEKLQRQSKYVGALIEKAEGRKREQEILFERRLAKERAAEDHLFGDKEKFVTAAYKKKLEEEQKWKDEQVRILEEEERNAVEKKGHMGDFYRNLLKNNVAFGTSIEEKIHDTYIPHTTLKESINVRGMATVTEMDTMPVVGADQQQHAAEDVEADVRIEAGVKKNTEDAVASAKERYLARKRKLASE